MVRDSDFQADLERYPERSFLREQSIWAVWLYRFGRRAEKRKQGVVRSVQLLFYRPMFRLVETLTGISLPLTAQIGPGLRIYHFGNIFVHPDAVVGRNCTLRQGVTIGNIGVEGPVPVVEDDVDFGAYAQVLGNVHVGRGATIGAMSVVLQNVPAGATAFGNPARILQRPEKRPPDNSNAERE
jgi:serine O-acetyltransferase